MYFWNINKLKDDLKKGPLAEKEAFKYLFVFVLIYTLAMTPTGDTANAGFDLIMYLALGLGGLYYAYKCNGGAEGKDFVTRYLAVSWVVSIRWLAMVFVPFLLGYLFMLIAAGGEINYWIESALLFFVTCIAIWMTGKHLKEIAGHKRDE